MMKMIIQDCDFMEDKNENSKNLICIYYEGLESYKKRKNEMIFFQKG